MFGVGLAATAGDVEAGAVEVAEGAMDAGAGVGDGSDAVEFNDGGVRSLERDDSAS